MFKDLCSTGNNTGLQPVSRPVEQIIGFFQELKKVAKKDACFKTCAQRALREGRWYKG